MSGDWYDAVGWRPIMEHVKLITAFLAEGLAERLLVSHDAGWYHVGEKNGGDIKPFTPIWDELLPALEREGMKPEMRRQLFITNPCKAYTIKQT